MALAPLLDRLNAAPDTVRAGFVGHLVLDVLEDVDVARLPAAFQEDLDRFVTLAGFAESDDDATTREKMTRFYAAHPLDPALLALFAQLVAETASSGLDAAAASARAVTGMDAPALAPVGAGGRKAGAVGGGTLGILAARSGRLAVQAPAPPQEHLDRWSHKHQRQDLATR